MSIVIRPWISVAVIALVFLACSSLPVGANKPYTCSYTLKATSPADDPTTGVIEASPGMPITIEASVSGTYSGPISVTLPSFNVNLEYKLKHDGIVIDAKKEYLALREAKKLGIVTIGVLDTDSDPDTVDVAIPANDDSIRAIELILSEMADAVAIGKTMVTARQEPAQRPRRTRSRRPVLARANQEEPQTLPIVEQKPVQNVDTSPQQAQAEQKEPS